MNKKQITHTGLVVAAHGRRGQLRSEDGTRMPYLVSGRRLHVVCGDRVSWHFEDQGAKALITAILERRNALERQPVGRPKKEILAANLTQLMVVCAPKPEPDWFLVDRYLCSGALMDCKQILIVNKTDLEETNEPEYQAALQEYKHIGYTCIELSADQNKGMDVLRQSLINETGILVGQSGVGKSSLINRLVPDAEIAVGLISAATEEGTHTTTASALHELPDGGRLIDTPGVRDFIPAISEARTVQTGFPEIVATADQCRFADCQHIREPDCAVKAAVENGEIFPRRYESYKRLLRTVID